MRVSTRDGIRLATDIYLPDAPGAMPAVLVRLPYDKCGRYTFMPSIAPLFTERGYAFVVQDVRGKFRSEGDTIAFDHEIEDGYDTIDWIVAQPWCDGNVGMWGDSYYGFTQWAAVASGHPALKAIVPRVTSADLGQIFGASTPTSRWRADLLVRGRIPCALLDGQLDISLGRRLRAPPAQGGLRSRVRGGRESLRES